MDRRFKEINEEYDKVNKDGRLNTNERAAVSKDVEAGKFKTMDLLMKYVTRPPSRSSSRYRDMREEPREKARPDLYRKHDVNKDGWPDDGERPTSVRPEKYYADEAKRKSAAGERQLALPGLPTGGVSAMSLARIQPTEPLPERTFTKSPLRSSSKNSMPSVA